MNQNLKNIVKRTILSDVIKHLENPEMTIIIGSRQTGKTTLLFQLKDFLFKKGYSEDEIFIFNLDLLTDLELFTDQQKFIDFLKERIGKRKLFVFVDEAQRVKNAGVFFKGIYDLNLPVKFVLTGSSTLEIKAKIYESLTGRKRIFHLHPFSFQEYLSFKSRVLAKIILKEEISSYSQKQVSKYLFNFITWGGYPKAAIQTNIKEKQQILKEIYSSYIERDVINFLKITQPLSFTKLFNILAGQIGQLVNFHELSNTVGITYRTLEKYLSILENTFIIKLVPPFFENKRKELTKMPKIYFLDTGLRNFAVDSFKDFDTRLDKGALLENFIFSEIIKNVDLAVHFWRTKDKAEVDFVLCSRSGKIWPIEVKATALRNSKINRGLQNFIKQYHPENALLINLGFQGKAKFEGTEISFIQPHEILRILSQLK